MNVAVTSRKRLQLQQSKTEKSLKYYRSPCYARFSGNTVLAQYLLTCSGAARAVGMSHRVCLKLCLRSLALWCLWSSSFPLVCKCEANVKLFSSNVRVRLKYMSDTNHKPTHHHGPRTTINHGRSYNQQRQDSDRAIRVQNKSCIYQDSLFVNESRRELAQEKWPLLPREKGFHCQQSTRQYMRLTAPVLF